MKAHEQPSVEHEYVDLELEFKDGVIVGCRHLGEGTQVDQVADVTVLQVLPDDESVPMQREVRNRLVRDIKNVFRRIR